MRDTSLQAYMEIQALGLVNTNRERVLRAVAENPDSTDRELALILGEEDPNRVRPRRKELFDLKLVIEAGKKVCSVSGREAYTWRINTDYRNRTLEEKVQCEHCDGRGYYLVPRPNADQ